VTEFVSEDDPERDTVDKLRECEGAGLPEYLWVDARPGRRDIRFHRRGDDGYRLVEADAEGRYHSLILPGFWFRPDWFWEDPLPDPNRLMLQIAPQA
jgi:Uma2 family endonuclease